MDIPSLPTDNLYKFMALSGVIVLIVFNYLCISTGFKNRNDWASLKSEMKLLENDTILLNTSNENFENLIGIVRRHIKQEYFKSGLRSGQLDSLLYLDGIYRVALIYPELMPAYEKLENLYSETKKQHYEFSTKMVRIENLHNVLQVKEVQFFILIVFLVFFDIIGYFLASKGFKLWYERVQIYQDAELRNSATKTEGNKEATFPN
jgi:hypothetical protein